MLEVCETKDRKQTRTFPRVDLTAGAAAAAAGVVDLRCVGLRASKRRGGVLAAVGLPGPVCPAKDRGRNQRPGPYDIRGTGAPWQVGLWGRGRAYEVPRS